MKSALKQGAFYDFFQQWFQLQSAAQKIGLEGTSSLGVLPIK